MGFVFYEDYNKKIRKLCKPYEKFMDLAANALPPQVNSLCDIGIGTGNFSKRVNDRLPAVKIFGVDKNPELLKVAHERLPEAKMIKGDAFNDELPTVDYLISSLTLHHLLPSNRQENLKKLLEDGRGLVNFDLFLSGNKTKEDLINNVVEFAKKSFPPEEIKEIIHEIETNDHPAYLESDISLFKSLGFSVEVIANEFPFAVYHVHSKGQI